MTAPRIVWLTAADPPESFPPAGQALTEPDGLLAAGGDLNEERILYAYRHGIFPWYDEGQPILWWSPDPRCVIHTKSFHLPRRARRSLRTADFTVGFNRRFADVMQACAAPRPGQHGTWITDDMLRAYTRLQTEGWAHSVEIMRDGQLVGGLYGLAIGGVFFGESMFSRESNASKAALLVACNLLAEAGSDLLDCQVQSQHLSNLGAEMMPRDEFLAALQSRCNPPTRFEAWPDDELPVGNFL